MAPEQSIVWKRGRKVRNSSGNVWMGLGLMVGPHSDGGALSYLGPIKTGYGRLNSRYKIAYF